MNFPLVFSQEIAVIVGFILAVLVIPPIIRHRRSPAGTIAWLLVVVLFPYLGAPLYLLLGGRKLRHLIKRKKRIRLQHGQISPKLKTAGILDVLLQGYAIAPATAGNQVRFCLTAEQAYRSLASLIERAQSSIHILTYIWEDDEVGRDIVARLTRRAQAGVEVRVLVDQFGSLATSRKFLAPLAAAGGKVAYFMPSWYRTNLRNHRKMVVIDNRLVIAGGRNIASKYISPVPGKEQWLDLSFVLEGPATRHYAAIFHSDWEFAHGESLAGNEIRNHHKRPKGSHAKTRVQVIPSGPDIEGDPLYDAILTMAFSAQQRLWVATPYFVPDDALTKAFSLAAKRGVEIKLLLPKKSNHPLADWARETYLHEIHAAGGEILLLEEMLHAKVILLDDTLVLIGSANLDMRSLFLNYEVSLAVYAQNSLRTIESWFLNLSSQAKKYSAHHNPWHEMIEGLVRLMSPLL